MRLANVLLLASLTAAQSAGLDTLLERLDAYLDQYEVPVTMRERFNSIADTGTSLATYTNFRRFPTSARIVPQP